MEPPISQQTFVESPSKPRNPKLRYSLEDSCANSSNSDQLLKEEYLHGRGLRNGDYGDNRDTDDDNVNDLSKTAMLQHFPRETDGKYRPLLFGVALSCTARACKTKSHRDARMPKCSVVRFLRIDPMVSRSNPP